MAPPGSLRVQAAGVGLALAALAMPVAAYAVEPAWSAGLVATMLAELVTGREAAIPLAVAAGTPPAWIALTSILQNLAIAALLVPLAVRAMTGLRMRQGYLGRFMQGLHDSAVQRLPRGRNSWALFLFMLVPFVANGPLLAGVIGNLAGIAGRRLAVVLVGAVVLTAAAWSYVFSWLSAILQQINPIFGLVTPCLAVLVAAAWLVTAGRKAMQPAS